MNSLVNLSRQAKFKFLSESITKAIEAEGFLIRPYGHPALPYFNGLPREEQEQVLKDLQIYFQVCLDMQANGDSLKDTRKFTERTLVRLDKRADPQLLDQLHPHHLVEIYTSKHTQVFRSLPYFEVCSYSLEDIYCRQWFHLYERSTIDQELLDKTLKKYFDQSPLRTIEVTDPEHMIREKNSLERMEFMTKLWWISPLFSNNGEDPYTLAVETSRLIVS